MVFVSHRLAYFTEHIPFATVWMELDSIMLTMFLTFETHQSLANVHTGGPISLQDVTGPLQD